MAIIAASIPIDPTVYRRQARRIRARFAGRPAAMHRALSGLAQRSDRVPWRAGVRLPADPVTGAIEKGFADYVAERITGEPFTYSDRMAVMQSAERIGISRFRANLIVSLALDSLSDPRPTSGPPIPRSDKAGVPLTAIILRVIAAETAVAALLYLLVG